MTMTGLNWRTTRTIPGAQVCVADVQRPISAADSWRATLGGHLYVLAGRATSDGQIAGYIGLSHAVNTGRPWVSMTQWVINERALAVDTIALVRFDREPALDVLKVLEARIIRGTSAAGIYTHNTNSSAPAASRALGASADRVAAFGDFVERVLRHQAFDGRTNPLPSPAATLRESAVRTVLAAGRAVDTDEVLARLDRIGVHYGGNTVGATARRDLTVREVATAGAPRVLSTHIGRKAVYYPRHLAKGVAIERYLASRS